MLGCHKLHQFRGQLMPHHGGFAICTFGHLFKLYNAELSLMFARHFCEGSLTLIGHSWLPTPTLAAVTMHFSSRHTFLHTSVLMPMCCSMSCNSICFRRMSNMIMQQMRLFSESVENSAAFVVGPSSSDNADVKLDSSSTTGAAIWKRNEMLSTCQI